MKCESAREQLIDFWNETLEADARAEIETHLEGCSKCREERAELEAMWARLGALGDSLNEPVPSAALRGRFYRELAEVQARLDRPGLWQRFIDTFRASGSIGPQPVWLAAMLVLGIGLGASVMSAIGARGEVRRLSAEVDAMSRSASLALLEHQSASERLRGVSWSSRSLTDDRIVEALLDSVRNDPNVNVRLAALGTLAHQTDSPRVRAGLIESLPRQQSPMLQVAMVEVLNQQNGGAKVAIQELLESDELDEDVRQQILSLLQSV
jgi:anti-sigma factor RsiW